MPICLGARVLGGSSLRCRAFRKPESEPRDAARMRTLLKNPTETHIMASHFQPAATTPHYGAEYFKWQFEVGRFGGWANLTKFSTYIHPRMKVLDFGCGCGYLLANINCKEKLGVEINPIARAEAEKSGIRTVASLSEIEDDWADLIISNHALEHCRHPLQELQALLSKVAPGGLAVFVVPCEAIKNRYRQHDRNHHLYSWSPMSLANLFMEAGFAVVECKPYIHSWPPRFIPRLLRSLGGRWLFELGCRVYGALTYLNASPALFSQIRVVAVRR
jgi:SAM-dependent methyltransferase